MPNDGTTARFRGGMNVPSRLGRMNATVPLADLVIYEDRVVLHPRFFARLMLTDFVIPLEQLASAARLRGRLLTSGVDLILRDGNEAFFWTLSGQGPVLDALHARGVAIDPAARSAKAALRPWRQQRSTSTDSSGVQPLLIRLMPISLLVGLAFVIFVLTDPAIGSGRWLLVPFWVLAFIYNIRLWLRARR